ncbi:MAG: ThiF family adenylyltransferase [Reyranella sp.]|nr:ThiF family adenylyltransferase [Reyranella sp.]
MIWCIENPQRSRQEREAVAGLAGTANWLTLGEWRLDTSACLVMDADLTVGERVYPVTLRYPNHFPHTPALVLPRGTNERWSNHQYGAGGELCLEHGPDNWRPEITGADMLQSAHRLLSDENPAPQQSGQVPSRHDTTLGQNLRGSQRRLLVTRALQAEIGTMPDDASWQGVTFCIFRDKSFVYITKSLDRGSAGSWTAPDVPVDVLAQDSIERLIAFVRWPSDAPLPSTEDRPAFYRDLRVRNPEIPDLNYVVIVRGQRLNAFFLWEDGELALPISIIPPQKVAARLDADHTALVGRRIAIVGCGSLGSKLAAMLARCGVGKFVLVDDDIMLPDNLVRHELDWREVGMHKADAVRRRIALVNPSASVEAREYRLGGQHSSGSIESLLETIAACDLIIDATADPHVFNYLCAATGFGKKPMLWAQVFAGGIGGMIARHRPGLEPDPATMRAQIEHWCHVQGKPIEHTAIDYETRGSGPPLIADDADVSVIAAHAARFAVDTLIPREPSAFPHAVYMIGMREGWNFGAPFETHPIDVGRPLGDAEAPVDPALAQEEA